MLLLDGPDSLSDARSRKASISDMQNIEIVLLPYIIYATRYRTHMFSNYFSNGQADRADDWLKSVSFASNQVI